MNKSTSAAGQDSTDWNKYSPLLSNFLATEQEYLLLGGDCLGRIWLGYLPDISTANLDLVQFCTLGLFEKGALGIRELHWRVSNYIVTSKILRFLVTRITFGYLGPFRSFVARYNGMISRKLAIDQMVGNLVNLGIPILHYVEPQDSNVIISREFANALLLFNPDGLLDFSRACFALARTSNFRCIRISGTQNQFD